MKTVYFLGAGASKGSRFELPTMNEFFDQLEGDNYPNLRGFLLEAFPGVSIKKLNMETVITHLELSLQGFGARWLRQNPYLNPAREDLDDYLQDRLKLPDNSPPGSPSGESICQDHEKLFQSFDALPEGGSVLTLNYDLICDCTL